MQHGLALRTASTRDRGLRRRSAAMAILFRLDACEPSKTFFRSRVRGLVCNEVTCRKS